MAIITYTIEPNGRIIATSVGNPTPDPASLFFAPIVSLGRKIFIFTDQHNNPIFIPSFENFLKLHGREFIEAPGRSLFAIESLRDRLEKSNPADAGGIAIQFANQHGIEMVDAIKNITHWDTMEALIQECEMFHPRIPKSHVIGYFAHSSSYYYFAGNNEKASQSLANLWNHNVTPREIMDSINTFHQLNTNNLPEAQRQGMLMTTTRIHISSQMTNQAIRLMLEQYPDKDRILFFAGPIELLGILPVFIEDVNIIRQMVTGRYNRNVEHFLLQELLNQK